MTFRRYALSTISALSAFCLVGAVQAATVSHQAGEVLIGKGTGFVPVTGSVDVAPGGQVMVRPGGLAAIYYPGCTVRIGSGFWVVQQIAPCPAGKSELDFTTRMSGGALDPPPPLQPRSHSWAVGGVIVGGAIAACVFWFCKDNDKPVSP